MKYTAYFDSGTSNSRIYLLDDELKVLYTEKKNIGSKDSSVAGTNRVLIEGLYELYTDMLKKNGLNDSDIETIYASGMITSPYGLHEVPHLAIPTTVENFKNNIYPHFEDVLFHRHIHLILGLKTEAEEMADVGNMRGEEIEIIGCLDEIKRRYGDKKVALIMPGSHTHTTLVQGDNVLSILSQMTGELFYAIGASTVLSAVLSGKDFPELDMDMLRKGQADLKKYGFTRAIYICHAMRIFSRGTELQRFSYGEGVVNGDFETALSSFCAEKPLWQGCETAAIVSEKFMFELYKEILKTSPVIKEVDWIPIEKENPFTVRGLRKILSYK